MSEFPDAALCVLALGVLVVAVIVIAKGGRVG